MRRAELLDRIDVLLGGRVAEEIVFGDISTGAQNDLQRVTDLARHMVTQYGMSDRLGLVTFEEPRTNPFLSVAAAGRSREYSEKTAQAIDEEIRAIIGDARTRVRETLTGRRAALDALAKLLVLRPARGITGYGAADIGETLQGRAWGTPLGRSRWPT